jgi:uncharacterized protein
MMRGMSPDALDALPRLGLGLSTEYDAAARGIDPLALHEALPGGLGFLEVGCDVERGLDPFTRRAVAAGLRTTYHFLDVNLEERDDLDPDWIHATVALAREIGAAWLCGDGGLWHFGPRDRGHQTLMPPILTAASADEMAETIHALAEATGFAVLPENPPASLYLGDLHILDYFARVADRSGCGLLLDCAHLAIFQRLRGLPPTAGLDGFPLDRVIELHVAGGTLRHTDGFAWIDDDHGPEPLPDTWEILEAVVPRAPRLKAIVYECERNRIADVAPNFARLGSLFG